MNILDSFPKTELDAKAEASLKPEALAVAYMHDAVLYARTCSADKIPDPELVSICYDAMLKVAARFKPARGRFFAFCKPRIRGALLRHWTTTAATVRNADTESLEADWDAACPVNGFDQIDLHERWAEVSEILARRCTDRERTIMQLVFSMNFTFEQTGSVLGISRAAAQAIASKVIERVKKILSA
jgi:RNA polymerase sigma factor (sigma-70 family)